MESMKKFMEDMLAERKELKLRIDIIDVAIEGFRSVCKHVNEKGETTFEFEGNDSHYNYYKCSICGEVDKI